MVDVIKNKIFVVFPIFSAVLERLSLFTIFWRIEVCECSLLRL